MGSANGTAVNTFYFRNNRLATSNDTNVAAPNHDTLYSQAWLDLSQVAAATVVSLKPCHPSNQFLTAELSSTLCFLVACSHAASTCMQLLSAACKLQGPQVITIPSFDSGRYWCVPLQDAYTNTYSALGSDFNTAAGQHLIVGRSRSSSHSLPAALLIPTCINSIASLSSDCWL